MGIEEKWSKMTERKVYSTMQEWEYARELMNKLIASGQKPPFKIPKDNNQLKHSFLVATNNDGEPIIGVIAQSNGNEGILGFGSFGVCKVVRWEDGKKNAIKIEPDDPDQHEVEIMQKLGLIRALFKRKWDKRIDDNRVKGKEPNTQWIAEKSITDKIYKVMPYIEGIDLNKYLSSNDATRTMATQRLVAVSILEKLQEMHDAGVLHNDLHSKNIMVDSNLNAYLIDFGKSIELDKIPTSIPQIAKLFGRNDTLAPEIIAFKEKLKRVYQKNPEASLTFPVSKASDIYSLGHLLAELFYPLGSEPQVKALLKEIGNEDPQKRISLSEILKTLNSDTFVEMVKEHDKWMAEDLLDPLSENQDLITDQSFEDFETEHYEDEIPIVTPRKPPPSY